MSQPLDRVIEAARKRGPVYSRNGDNHYTQCPVHNGNRNDSLWIAPGEKAVVIKCLTHGCAKDTICTALGLRGLQDLYDDHKPISTPGAYQYLELSEAAFADAVDDALAFVTASRTKSGKQPPLPSDCIATSYKLACRRFGAQAFSIPPTPAEMERNDAELRAELQRSCSIYDAAGRAGLQYLKSRGVDLINNSALSPQWVAEHIAYHPSWLRKNSAVLFAVTNYLGHRVASTSRFLHPRNSKEKAWAKGMIRLGVFQTPGALAADAIAIVEAPIDALTLALCGLPAVATIGSSRNKPTFWPRLRARRFIIATDSDPGGEQSATELTRILGPERCERFTYPPGVKDANAWIMADPAGLRSHVTSLLNM